MTRKVLLASIQVGGGHRALADSFQMALQKADPSGERFQIENWQSQDESTEEIYKFIVRKLRQVQGWLHSLSQSEVLYRVLLLNQGWMVKEAKQVLLDKRPDVVVSTHFMLTSAFVMARNELGVPTRIVTAIPDYGPPTSAFFPRLRSIRPDNVIVMEERTHEHLQTRRQLPPSVLHFSGFLTREAFSRLSAQISGERRFGKAQRQNLVADMLKEHPQLRAFDAEKPTLIFLGGSAWTEKTLPVLERLFQDKDFVAKTNLIIVSGNNPDFHSRMTQLTADVPNVMLFGFVSPTVMAQLIALADFPVLGSLAPASLHELLELRCGPLFLHHFIPGTERPHVRYIQEQNIGLYEADPDKMVSLLRKAVGLEPRTPELERLISEFPKQALRIRTANKQRSAQLADFLEQAARQAPVQHVSRTRKVSNWLKRGSAAG